MKQFVPLALMVLAATVCVSAQQDAQSNQSVGDVARKSKAQDQAAPSHKVWTNEDFPDDATPAAQPTEPSADASPTTPSTPDDSQKNVDLSADKAKAKDPAADQEKLDAEWKGKIDAQRARINDLKREYDLTQREEKISATTYYADAGNRLRDQKDFLDKENSYHDKLATMQKQIADEEAKLSDMQDQAHKAGANKAYE